MSEDNSKPVIFLAFANPPAREQSFLRNLGEEARRLEVTLKQAKQDELCDLVVKPYATLETILGVFREYRNRIAIFHYAGHAHNYHLLLEDAQKGTTLADAGGLAAFLGQQRGLQLVFLNGCATQPQVEGLLEANVPLVIATAQAIKDEVAMNFADQFYQSLTSGANVQTAYNEAEAAVRISEGSSGTRDVYRSSTRDASFEGEELLADRWPWDLYVKPGAETATEWNLPDAVDDHLFGLPPLPELDLPESPFRHLHWFEREHAEVFFGRGYEIRKLFEQVTASQTPIILLYGQSGVGKSSLLAAGLLPRLEADYETRYARRDRDRGLLGTLRLMLNGAKQDLALAEAWHQLDAPDRPLVVVLDQLEEVYTRPQAGQPDELDRFLTALQDLFANPSQHPPGKLILGFRKEWLADIEKRLKEHRLPRAKLFLERLERKGIVEAIVGPTRSKRLQSFGLTVAEELPSGEKLPDIIAGDLLEDPDSPVAPTLQILLTKMWERAKAEDYDRPQFDLELYHALKRKGLLLKDFLEQQLEALAEWRKDVVASGLALDLLAFHTSPQGTAEQRSQARLLETYAHRRDDIPPLVQQGEDLYLLVDPSKNQPDQPKASRLAHDALSPLVRQKFDESDAPGQRARRILESRAVDWVDEKGQPKDGPPLDEQDLGIVEAGKAGMRDLIEPETRLLDASREAQVQREQDRKKQRWIRNGLIALVLTAAVAAVFLWRLSAQQRDELAQTNIQLEQTNIQLAEEQENTEQARQSLEERNQQLTEQQGKTEKARQEAERQSKIALDRAQEAEEAQAEAEKQANLALSRLLTIQSDNQLNANKNQLALLLAVEAGNTTDTPEAVDALYAALPRIRHNLVNLVRNFGPVIKAGWNRDGTRFIIIGVDGIASVWDWSTAESYRLSLSGHSGQITQVVWNPDGTHILTASMDGTVRVWQAEPSPAGQGNPTDDNPLTLIHPGPVTGATWNADGTRILTTSCHEVISFNACSKALAQVWDAQTGAKLSSFVHPGSGPLTPTPPGPGLLATWNDTGTRILTTGCRGHLVPLNCDDVAIAVWDAETGNQLTTLFGHSSWVNQAVWNGDGSRVLTASNDGTARVWDGETGEQLGPNMNHEYKVKQAAWSADEIRILTSTLGGTAHLWDAETGFEMQRFTQVDQAVWNSQGTHILIASQDGSLRVLDAETGIELITLVGHEGRVRQAVWNAEDTRLITVGWDDTPRLWDVETNTELPTLHGHAGKVNQAIWNADGTRILTANDNATAQVWDANTGVVFLSLLGHSDGVNQAVWNPSETRILTASRDGTARIWDAETGDNLVTLSGHTDWVEQAVWSADEMLVLTASRDGTARVWDAEIGDEMARLNHPEPVQEATWNADETRILTLSLDNLARVWGAETENEMNVLVEQSGVRQVVWSPDGTRILTISSDEDQSTLVRDAETGGALVTFVGHADKVNYAVWNEDGTRILTASEDGTTKVWDAQTGDEILSLNHDVGGINQAAWIADESLIFTRGYSKVWIWDAETGTNLGTHSVPPGIAYVTWNGNGSRFLVTYRSGTVRQHFAPRTQVLVERACQLTSRNLSPDEWRRFMEGEPYRATCPKLEK